MPIQVSCDTPSTVNSSRVVGRSTWAHYLDHSFSVLFCPCFILWLSSAEKCVSFFLFSLSENGKRSKKSISLSVSDPHSQLRHYFQVELASSASWASMVWYSVMQQVFFLFHSFSPSLSLSLSFSCTNRGTCDFLLIVIRQSAVYEGQYFEGGHERNKPIRGERWDESVIDWLVGGGGGERNMHTQ